MHLFRGKWVYLGFCLFSCHLSSYQRGRRGRITEERFYIGFANRTEQNGVYNGLFVKFMKLCLRFFGVKFNTLRNFAA